MSRNLSPNARQAERAQHSAEVAVRLLIIEHPAWNGEILRLSDDASEVISLDPYLMGTRSMWRSTDGKPKPFLFSAISVVLPGEGDNAPSQGSLVVEILDSDLSEKLESTTEQGTCHMAIVMASTPNLVEAEWLHMKIFGAEVDAGRASLSISSEPILDERYPADRMTKERFPGLHR